MQLNAYELKETSILQKSYNLAIKRERESKYTDGISKSLFYGEIPFFLERLVLINSNPKRNNFNIKK